MVFDSYTIEYYSLTIKSTIVMSNSENGSNQSAAKKSTTETGNAINLANFLLIIQTVSKLKDKYKPSNPDLEIKALEINYKAAKNDLDNCTKAETDFDKTTTSRSGLFKQMKKLSGRAHRGFKATKVPQAAKDQAQTIMNKLHGNVSKPKKKEILLEGEEGQKSISNSQQSYSQLIEHFKKLRGLLTSYEAYKPNEADLTPVALLNFENDLYNENRQVGDAITNWKSLRRSRSKTFYATETGIVDTAFQVKDYVASVFGIASPEYKEVNKIKFRNIKDK